MEISIEGKMNKKNQDKLQHLLELDFTKLEPNEALDKLGILLDLSYDQKFLQGTEKAIKIGENLLKSLKFSKDKALLYYFLANAHSDKHKMESYKTEETIWAWESPYLEKPLLYLRQAILEPGFNELSRYRKAQIFTNLGNMLISIGRSLEAIEYWDQALLRIEGFPMALGNKGVALAAIANVIYDLGHRYILYHFAKISLEEAIGNSKLIPITEEAYERFNRKLVEVEKFYNYMGCKIDSIDLNNFSLGDTKQEIEYRKWCLRHRLFINPLNDVGNYNLSARDPFLLPSIITGIEEGPHFHGLFNQIKQEFASARFLLYQGLHFNQPHYSDREVYLYDTLDYPVYSLGIEQVKFAYRSAYSIFDKIAFFLNKYFDLKIPEHGVAFRSLWFKNQSKDKGLRNEFNGRKNWPLRGLYWLSKDLYEQKGEFKESLEPEAQELQIIRNQMEHKFLKVHELLPPKDAKLEDDLAYSIWREELKRKTIKLFKMVRSAIMYLSMAIYVEEAKKRKGRAGKIVKIKLPLWEDEWKR